MTYETLKTTFGFIATVVRKYLHLGSNTKAIEDIYNYLPISATVATSGQPTAGEFSAIRNAGFQSVINLAPDNAQNALPDEGDVVGRLGLRYTHIPVDFSNPTAEDFQKFVAAMENAANEKTWVHCAANMRVSAFMYKYRRDILKEDAAEAKKALSTIWKPFGVWSKFIE